MSVGQAESGVNIAGNNINQNIEYNIQQQPIRESSKTRDPPRWKTKKRGKYKAC